MKRKRNRKDRKKDADKAGRNSDSTREGKQREWRKKSEHGCTSPNPTQSQSQTEDTLGRGTRDQAELAADQGSTSCFPETGKVEAQTQTSEAEVKDKTTQTDCISQSTRHTQTESKITSEAALPEQQPMQVHPEPPGGTVEPASSGRTNALKENNEGKGTKHSEQDPGPLVPEKDHKKGKTVLSGKGVPDHEGKVKDHKKENGAESGEVLKKSSDSDSEKREPRSYAAVASGVEQTKDAKERRNQSAERQEGKTAGDGAQGKSSLGGGPSGQKKFTFYMYIVVDKCFRFNRDCDKLMLLQQESHFVMEMTYFRFISFFFPHTRGLGKHGYLIEANFSVDESMVLRGNRFEYKYAVLQRQKVIQEIATRFLLIPVDRSVKELHLFEAYMSCQGSFKDWLWSWIKTADKVISEAWDFSARVLLDRLFEKWDPSNQDSMQAFTQHLNHYKIGFLAAREHVFYIENLPTPIVKVLELIENKLVRLLNGEAGGGSTERMAHLNPLMIGLSVYQVCCACRVDLGIKNWGTLCHIVSSDPALRQLGKVQNTFPLLLNMVVGLINNCARKLVSELVLLVPLLHSLRSPGTYSARLGPAVEEANWTALLDVEYRPYRENIRAYPDKRRMMLKILDDHKSVAKEKEHVLRSWLSMVAFDDITEFAKLTHIVPEHVIQCLMYRLKELELNIDKTHFDNSKKNLQITEEILRHALNWKEDDRKRIMYSEYLDSIFECCRRVHKSTCRITRVTSLFKAAVLSFQLVLKVAEVQHEELSKKGEEKDKGKQFVSQLENMQQEFSQWRNGLLHKPLFSQSRLSYPNEIEIWNAFFELDCSVQCVREQWLHIVETDLRKRISELSDMQQVQVCCLEMSAQAIKKSHSNIQTCFDNLCLSAISNICQEGKEGDLLRTLLSDPKCLSSSILSSILVESAARYGEDTVTQLLDGQSAIHVLLSQGDRNQWKLNKDANQLIEICLTTLSSLVRSLCLGDIPLGHLQAILKHSKRFERLYQNCKRHNKFDNISIDAEELLVQREKDLKALEEQRIHMDVLIKMIAKIAEMIHVPEISLLEQQHKMNKQTLSLNELVEVHPCCSKEDLRGISTGRVLYYSADPVMLDKARQMHEFHESNLLLCSWVEKATALASATSCAVPVSVKLMEVFSEIWEPSLHDFSKLALRIAYGVATFEEVDKVVDGCGDEGEGTQIKKELNLMAAKLESYQGPEKDWPELRLSQIQEYRQLYHAAESAGAVMKIRDRLNLQGDFSHIYCLTQLREDSFKRKTLESLSNDLISAKQRLLDVKHQHTACLEAFLESEKLVSWVKAHIKDLSELKVFMELASISAGENDAEIDRLASFHDAVMGYSPLLYSLSEMAGFEDFILCAQQVWDTLRRDEKLSGKLKDSSRWLDWLKSLRETHGSVEQSSLSLASAINTHGVYNVGWPDGSSGNKCLGSVLCMKVMNNERDKTYSLDDLLELQNKLMLMSSKGEHGKEQVNKFTEVFEGVQRMGRILLQLCSSGNVFFQDMRALVKCNPENDLCINLHFPLLGKHVVYHGLVTERLQEVCRSMEACHEDWRSFMSDMRCRFHVLNNFTSEQLVYLCYWIHSICVTGKPVPQQIWYLLTPLNPKSTLNDIRDAFAKARGSSNSLFGCQLGASFVKLDSKDSSGSEQSMVPRQDVKVGKSLCVKRMFQHFKTKFPSASYLPIRLIEPSVDMDLFIQTLLEKLSPLREKDPVLLHIDTGAVQCGLEEFLFKLLVLGCLCNNEGKLWRRNKAHLLAIEALLPDPAHNTQTHKESNQGLLHLLPTIHCRPPKEVKDLELQIKNDRHIYVTLDPLMDRQEFESEGVQRPYQYLKRLKENENLDHFRYKAKSVEDNPVDCLQYLLSNCGLKDPSWAELKHFTWFLNLQLKDCENSAFCDPEFFADNLCGFKNFIVKFMIHMARDFASPSLDISDQSSFLLQKSDQGDDLLARLTIRKRWENEPHPYIFFNADHLTMTFLGFHVEQNSKGTLNAVDPRNSNILMADVMSHELFSGLQEQRISFSEDFDQLPRKDKIKKLSFVVGADLWFDPDPTYELTADNVMKMLAIHMRFRCEIPVIIMGETGCGKTRLVKFLCDLQREGRDVENMKLVKVHGGTTADAIYQKVKEAETLAEENSQKYNLDTILFFDEANTTESIFAIKEVLCDKTVKGFPLKKNSGLKIIAACNPYRKHSTKMIERLERAGLGYRVKAGETEDRLGKVPMRQLVYRVHPLPPSMMPLVWDFGQLNDSAEFSYICQIVQKQMKEHCLPLKCQTVVTSVLAASQIYMRRREDECSFVSLRDVERSLKVLVWFYQHREHLFPNYQSTDIVQMTLKCLALALGVCYYPSLEFRENYLLTISKYFLSPLNSKKALEDEISSCQDFFLQNIQTRETIAKNLALKENVFLMVVCIELRIPLFLVGKPGSSKSLAKTVVADAMQRQASHCELFQKLKEVHMVSFQCSPHSSPEGIIGTFRNCARFQKDKNMDEYVSVVVLDEIGLAEDSPQMPLKTLHPLLEDGCIDREKPDLHMKVGFVGISNWALDPAKMNRGIFVSRWDPSETELVETANGICSSSRSVLLRMKHLLPKLAKGFLSICKSDNDQFFGLRDYYCLVKMIFTSVKKSDQEPSDSDLAEAILRNFSGQKGNFDPLNHFQDLFFNFHEVRRTSTLKMIEQNIDYHNEKESRYLLLLTTNNAALYIIQQCIFSKGNYTCPEIVFGSGFPKDQEYAQICRNVSRVKMCMETGRTVILLNLLNLYESLYDALNQYYVYFSGQQYVDLGLGSHRVKCRVHRDFRLVVIEDQEKVYDKFPIPLKNRLEKHRVDRSTDLAPWQCKVLEKLTNWVQKFSQFSRSFASDFIPTDAFVGFHGDACASALLQALERKAKQDNSEVGDGHIVFNMKDNSISVLTEEGSMSIEGDMKENKTQGHTRGEGSDSNQILPDDKKSAMPDNGVQSDVRKVLSDEDAEELLMNVDDNLEDIRVERERVETLENISELEEVDIGLADLDTIKYNLPKKTKDEEEEVFEFAKYFLLNCATPDSVLRLKYSELANQEVDRLQKLFFHQQNHHSLRAFMDSHLQKFEKEKNRFIEVTTFSSLLTKADVRHLSRTLGLNMEQLLLLSLHQFDTEASFCSRIRYITFLISTDLQGGSCVGCFLQNAGLSLNILLVQMDMEDSPCKNELIASAKYCTMNELLSFPLEDRNCYIVFITKLARIASGNKYIGFQGGAWLSVHIDDLRDTDDMSLDLSVFCGKPISKLLSQTRQPDIMGVEQQRDMPKSQLNETAYLHSFSLVRSCTQKAVSLLRDPVNKASRSMDRMQILLGLLGNDSGPIGAKFQEILLAKLVVNMTQREELIPEAGDWVNKEAMKQEALQEGGTLRHTLWRYLQSVLTPTLAQVFEVLDRDSNLNLLYGAGDGLVRFWLDIFSDGHILDLTRPRSSSSSEQEINVQCNLFMSGEQHNCSAPFSWLIRLYCHNLWEESQFVRCTAQRSEERILQFVSAVTNSSLGGYIGKLSETDQQELGQKYLTDFVLLSFKIQTEEELRDSVYRSAVLGCITALQQAMGVSPNLSPAWITAATRHYTSRLDTLSHALQLQSHLAPLIFKQNSHDRPDMCEDILALGICVEETKLQTLPSLAACRSFLGRVELLQPCLQRAFTPDYSSLCCSGSLKHLDAIKTGWLGMLVVAAFIEQVVVKVNSYDESLGALTLKHCSQLQRLVEEYSDLQSKATLQQLIRVLNDYHEESTSRELRVFFHMIFFPPKLRSEMSRVPWGPVQALRPAVRARLLSALCEEVDAKTRPKAMPQVQDSPAPRLPAHSFRQCGVSVPDSTCLCSQLVHSYVGARYKYQLTIMSNYNHLRQHEDVRRCCNSFFLEVVSRFCLSEEQRPQEDMVELLFSLLISAQGDVYKTRELTPFLECVDQNPVARSVLPKLLLQHSFDQVKGHIQTYLGNLEDKLLDDNDKTELYRLFVNCFQDCLPSPGQLTALEAGEACRCQQEDINFLGRVARKQVPARPHQAAELLLTMARLRTCLDKAAGVLPRALGLKSGGCADWELRLLEQVKAVCEYGENDWYRVYLLRAINRQAGTHCVQAVMNSAPYEWILPVELLRLQRLVPADVDRFLCCGQLYRTLRDGVGTAVLDGSTQKLRADMQDASRSDSVKGVLLCLALFRQVTCCSRLAEPALQPGSSQELDNLINLVREKTLGHLRELCTSLLTNQPGGLTPYLHITGAVSAGRRPLLELLVHASAVFNSGNRLLLPLHLIACRPQTMTETFLPTMPDDNTSQVHQWLKEKNLKMYTCRNGHPCMIGECGKPMVFAKCDTCGVQIGGQNHSPAPGFKQVQGRLTDKTRQGHILGEAGRRSDAPSRGLPMPQSCVLRLWLHLAMLHGSSLNHQGISALIHPKVHDVNEFLWGHVERDMEVLGKSLNLNWDDTAIIIHLILNTAAHPPTGGVQQGAAQLSSRQTREQWEKEVCQEVIDPIIKDLNRKLRDAQDCITDDNRLCGSALMMVLKGDPRTLLSLPSNCPSQHTVFWTPSDTPSIEHLSQVLAQNNAGKPFPLLSLFLDKVQFIRQLACLPELAALLSDLMRVVPVDTETHAHTIGTLLQSMPEGHQRNTLTKRIKTFFMAWNHLRMELENNAAVGIDPDLCSKDISMESSAEFLSLSRQGPGSCLHALVDLLSDTHNSLVREARKLSHQEEEDRDYSVPVGALSESHLALCHPEKELLPLVLAHCQYTLVKGQQTASDYDLQSIERHLYRRCLAGKPRIQTETDKYLKRHHQDFSEVLKDVRTKIPQKPLKRSVCSSMRMGLRSFTDVCDGVYAVEIGLRFLSKTGGHAQDSLLSYLKDDLRMEQHISSRVAKALAENRLDQCTATWQLFTCWRSELKLQRDQCLTPQEPLPRLSKDFKKKLSGEERKDVRDFLDVTDVELFTLELHEILLLKTDSKSQTSYSSEWERPSVSWSLISPPPVQAAGHREKRNVCVCVCCEQWAAKLTVSLHPPSIRSTMEIHLEEKGTPALPGLDILPEAITLSKAVE
ncbi:hypothetical protein P4O66_011142, partial [Electrophorus voltai]